MRDVALYHPDPEAAFLDALQDILATRCGQGSKGTLDVFHRGRLQGNDRSDVVHHPRVAEHAFHPRLGESLENRVKHLDARGVGQDPDAPIPREGLEVEVARLDRPGVEDPRSNPVGFGREQRKGARGVGASMIHGIVRLAHRHGRPRIPNSDPASLRTGADAKRTPGDPASSALPFPDAPRAADGGPARRRRARARDFRLLDAWV